MPSPPPGSEIRLGAASNDDFQQRPPLPSVPQGEPEISTVISPQEQPVSSPPGEMESEIRLGAASNDDDFQQRPPLPSAPQGEPEISTVNSHQEQLVSSPPNCEREISFGTAAHDVVQHLSLIHTSPASRDTDTTSPLALRTRMEC